MRRTRQRLATLATLGPLPAFAAGLFLLWVAERTFVGTAHRMGLLLATLLCVAAVATSLLRIAFAGPSRRAAYVWLLRCYVGQCWALVLYGVCRGSGPRVLQMAVPLLQILWPAVLLRAFLPTLLLEYAVAKMRHAPTLELGRVRLAARAARLLWFGAITFASVNYAGTVFAHRIDLSYFRTTQVGAASQSLAQSLQTPVRITLFFPPGNEVLEQARLYATSLCALSPQLSLEVLDHALAGERAHALGVRGNGALVVEAGGHREVLPLALDLEGARRTLRNLDGEVLRRLLRALRPVRTVYFTTGHGERDMVGQGTAPERGLSQLKGLLEQQGYAVRRLGLGEGLAANVPSDAQVLAVVGPTEAMGPQEQASIARYLAGGGRLLLALNGAELTANAHGSYRALLQSLGTALDDRPLANAHFLVRLEGAQENNYNLLTTSAAEHPATASMRKHAGRMGLVLPNATAVRAAAPVTSTAPGSPTTPLHSGVPGTPSTPRSSVMPVNSGAPGASIAPASPGASAIAAAPSVTPLLWSMPGTWRDADRNGRRDAPAEPEASFAFAVAIDQPQSKLRAIVVGSADFASNAAVQNPGNAYFLLDSIHWLSGDEATGAAIESEVDAPLLHRKADDALWFYGLLCGLPGLLVFGAVLAGRRGRAQRSEDTHRAQDVQEPPRPRNK